MNKWKTCKIFHSPFSPNLFHSIWTLIHDTYDLTSSRSFEIHSLAGFIENPYSAKKSIQFQFEVYFKLEYKMICFFWFKQIVRKYFIQISLFRSVKIWSFCWELSVAQCQNLVILLIIISCPVSEFGHFVDK